MHQYLNRAVLGLSAVLLSHGCPGAITASESANELQAQLEEHIVFRDEYRQWSIPSQHTYRPITKPWTAREKQAHLIYFLGVRDLAPGLFQRAVAYRPIACYRTDTTDAKGTILATPNENSITFPDEEFPLFGDAGISMHALLAAFHEVTHLADPFQRIARSREWLDLVGGRLARAQERFLRERGFSVAQLYEAVPQSKDLDLLTRIAREEGLPTAYSTLNAIEALAEFTAYIVATKDYSPPADIKAFIESRLLVMPFELDPVDQHMHCGLDAMMRGEASVAEKAFSRALDLDPDLLDGYILRATVRRTVLTTEAADGAIADYSEAIRIDPTNASHFHNRGFTLRARMRFGEALNDFSEAIRLNPENEASYWCRAEMRQSSGRYDKAIADYSDVIRINPNGVAAYVRRAHLWEAQEEFDKAIADHGETIRINPGNVPAYIARGNLRKKQKMFDEAIAEYSEAIRRAPDSRQGYALRASIWIDMDEYTKAIADYSEVIRIKPDDFTALYLRGECRLRNKEPLLAIADFSRVLEGMPDHAMASYSRALAWRDLKENDKAIADFSEQIRKRPEEASSYGSRADLWFTMGEYEKAISDYNRILELRPGLTQALIGRGRARHKLGRFPEAVEDYRAALETDPKDRPRVEQWLAEAGAGRITND